MARPNLNQAKVYDDTHFGELFHATNAVPFKTTDPAATIANVVIVQGIDVTHAYLVTATNGDAIAAADVIKIATLTGLTSTTAIVDGSIV